MASVNPAVTGSTATHGHGIPETITPTTIPGHVYFNMLAPLHVGDPWIEHYVPEWESSHPISVITGAMNVLCDERPLAGTGISSVMCGVVTVSPVMNTILVP